MDKFASEFETLRHFSTEYFKWHMRRTTLWLTADDKWIDDTVMYSLSKRGYFDRKPGSTATYGAASETITDKGIYTGFWVDFFQALGRYATRELYREYYSHLRANYHRYCMIDEPGYSWFERLKALKQDEQCPIKHAVLTSWLARID